jgi:hypothetical protein
LFFSCCCWERVSVCSPGLLHHALLGLTFNFHFLFEVLEVEQDGEDGNLSGVFSVSPENVTKRMGLGTKCLSLSLSPASPCDRGGSACHWLCVLICNQQVMTTAVL